MPDLIPPHLSTHTHNLTQRQPHRWLPPNLNTSYLVQQGKIDFYPSPNNNPTQTTSPTSEFPSPELLTELSASRISPRSCFTEATISLHDSQSFVTDYSQRWPSQPKTPQLPAASTTPETTSHAYNQEADFVLIPSYNNPRLSRRSIERAQATSRISPNLRLGSATYGLQEQQQQHLRRNSANTNSTGQSPNPFYSTSAPTSSAFLCQPRTRPPVPLFPISSSGNMHPNMKAESSLSKGSSFLL